MTAADQSDQTVETRLPRGRPHMTVELDPYRPAERASGAKVAATVS